MSVCITFHDSINIRQLSIPDDENRRGILSKVKGHLLRIALVLHALELAVNKCTQAEEYWSFMIHCITVERAVVLVNHLIDQKFSLMPAEERF